MPTATRGAKSPRRNPPASPPDDPGGTDAIVTELYRGLLGREPEADGLRYHANTLAAGATLTEVLRSFVGSPEFAAKFDAATGANRYIRVDYDPPMSVELNYTPAQIALLWSHIAATWAGLGDDDPYWSVLSDPRFRMPNMSDAAVLDTFYASGSGDVARLDAWLHRNSLALRPDMVCAEYGCGVGRASFWLARRMNHLRAFDISPTHIARAESWLAGQSIHNVDFQLVRSPADLDRLAGIDLFFSLIVLQHNPPPIIALILDRAFRHLNPGGIAYFQLPTHRRGYDFSLDDYIASLDGVAHIEMHCLPQQEVFRLAARHGVVPLEIQQDGMTNDVGTSHTFLMRKV